MKIFFILSIKKGKIINFMFQQGEIKLVNKKNRRSFKLYSQNISNLRIYSHIFRKQNKYS